MEFSGLARAAKSNICTRHWEKENKKQENVKNNKRKKNYTASGGVQPGVKRIRSERSNLSATSLLESTNVQF